jgi:CheY-like chemotaxis protein
MRICLIEDNAALRDALALALEDLGFDLFQAADGVAGLESAEQNNPDIVITDMEMPTLGGAGVIHSLRTLRPHVRIIAMSGTGLQGEHNLLLAQAKGADKVLHKPFTIEALIDAIASLSPKTNAA